MRLRALLLVLASLFFAAPAAAEETRWYGWQTLAVDGAALTMIVAAASSGSSLDDGTVAKAALFTGLGTYAVGGMAVHLGHGNPLKAVGSLGLRVLLPVVTGIVGVELEQTGCRGTDWCGVGGAALGVLGGIASAVAIDAAVLAWEPVKRAPGISVGIVPRRGGATAGLSGSF